MKNVNTFLLDYVKYHNPDFSFKKEKHRKRNRILAKLAREIFIKKEKRTPEIWL